MCGRFALTLPTDAMAQLFAAQPANDLPQGPNFNICPTNPIAVVRRGDSGRQLVTMRWGFLPEWYQTPTDGPLLINARAETLAHKPAFAAACRARRCLIPADGFYEWTKDEQGQRLPWYFRPTDGGPMMLAGIWQPWGVDNLATCAFVTTAANVEISKLHHRMPLVLPPDSWPLWLGETGHGAARLMQPGAPGQLQFHRVSRRVNCNRASGPELIAPIPHGPKPPPDPGQTPPATVQGRLL